MRLTTSHKLICVAPSNLCNGIRTQLEQHDWQIYPVKREGNVEQIGYGRACEMPYKLAPRHKSNTVLHVADPIAISCQELINWINAQDGLDTFEPVRSCVAVLQPGGTIFRHRDRQWLHANSRRMHIPLKSNLNSWHTGFKDPRDLIGETYTMLVDHLYEINNIDPHKGKNDSNEARWHLVVDFMPKGFLEMMIDQDVDPWAETLAGAWPDWIHK